MSLLEDKSYQPNLNLNLPELPRHTHDCFSCGKLFKCAIVTNLIHAGWKDYSVCNCSDDLGLYRCEKQCSMKIEEYKAAYRFTGLGGNLQHKCHYCKENFKCITKWMKIIKGIVPDLTDCNCECMKIYIDDPRNPSATDRTCNDHVCKRQRWPQDKSPQLSL